MTAVARPYARALLAASGSERDTIAVWLQAVAGAWEGRLSALATNPDVKPEMLIAALVPEGQCAPLAHIIGLLIANHRLAALPEIAIAFAALKDEADNLARATITSAQPLTGVELASLQTALARRTGHTVELAVETDARLLAGVIVQHGDMVLDGSVRGRIAALAHVLSPF